MTEHNFSSDEGYLESVRTSRTSRTDAPLAGILARFQPPAEEAPAGMKDAPAECTQAEPVHGRPSVFHLRASGASVLPPTPEGELGHLLQRHDWHAHLSDSFDVINAGEKVVARMLALVRRCDPETVRWLWQQYGKEDAASSPTWDDLAAHLQQPQASPPTAAQEQALWDDAAAETSAAHWSARLCEQLALAWLTRAQRNVLEGRLQVIQKYLREHTFLLIDQDNMRLWIEGTFARWEQERRS